MRERHFDGTNSKPRKVLENAQPPTCRVHALLDRMAGRKNQQTRKMFLGRGTKHCWQDHTAKIPANIMTRLRARCHKKRMQANPAGEQRQRTATSRATSFCQPTYFKKKHAV